MIDWTKPVETEDGAPVRVLWDGCAESALLIHGNLYHIAGGKAWDGNHGDDAQYITVRNVQPKPVKRNVVIKVRQNRHGELIADVFEMGKEPQLPQYIAETMVCIETIPATTAQE